MNSFPCARISETAPAGRLLPSFVADKEVAMKTICLAALGLFLLISGIAASVLAEKAGPSSEPTDERGRPL